MAQSGDKAERDARMHARRCEGLTLAAIAREFGLSPETVRLTVRLVERKAKWHETDRNAQWPRREWRSQTRARMTPVR